MRYQMSLIASNHTQLHQEEQTKYHNWQIQHPEEVEAIEVIRKWGSQEVIIAHAHPS